MNPISYNLRKFNENFKNLKATGKSYKYLPTLFDFIFCIVKYGASANDYFDYEFFDKKASAKEQFVCYKLKRKFFKTMNDVSKAPIFDNKAVFLKTFQSFIGRDFLDIEDATEAQFEQFVKKHPTFMVKNPIGSCGRGIYKKTVDDNTDLKELYDEFKKDNTVLEEIVVQHSQLNDLYPKCLNTIRIATVKINNEVQILGACLRCGNGSNDVDNFCNGGIAAKIDPESGVIISDAVSKAHQRFYKHPITGVIFHGFKIPYWDKAVDIVKKAMDVVEDVNYIGWDIAIRQDDVIIIEGNFEGMLFFQKLDNTGIKPQIEAIISETIGNR